MKLSSRLLITVLVAGFLAPGAAFAAKGDRKKPQKPASFATVDKNADESISESEYVAANEKLSPDAAKSKFATLDKNHDGNLSKDEYGTDAKEKKKPRKKKNQ